MWKPGANMPAGTAHEHPVMFAPEAIRDRDLIRDWAIIADGVEQLHALVRKMEQSETTVPNEEDGRNSGA
jgi:plasmid stabilization system protein ParE